MSDTNKVHPNVDKSELRGRIFGNLDQMRSSIDCAKNIYEVFNDIGITPENLNNPTKRDSLISKMTSMRNALALLWHPDKNSNKADQERYALLQKAYELIKSRKQHALDNETNLTSSPAIHYCTFNNESNSWPLMYQIQSGYSLDDVLQEFKDFYQQQTGKMFNAEIAAKEGYSYSISTDNSGNSILSLSCPDMQTRNDCIQRLLDKNMIASPWQSLQSAKDKTEKDTSEERSWLPRLEPSWASEKTGQ